ncbi:MAG: hypothetical protein QOD98_681 [Nocardioidaceae bacterium]|nr:hypothetical protein [Nocardioidaceae bacterium]
MVLAVSNVTVDPVLSFVSTGAADLRLHVLLFSGVCGIEKQRHGRSSISNTGVRLGFYVPGAGPLRPSYLLSAWAEVTLAWTRIASGTAAQSGPYGVDEVTTELVDDGKGSGSMWPYVWMRAWGGQPMLLRYRLTVTQPLDR